jgi:hypothetical protein
MNPAKIELGPTWPLVVVFPQEGKTWEPQRMRAA